MIDDDSFLLPNKSAAPLRDNYGYTAEQYESVGLLKDETGNLKPSTKLVVMFALASMADYAIGMVGTILFTALSGFLLGLTPVGVGVSNVLSQLGVSAPLWQVGATLGTASVLWELTVRSRLLYTKLADHTAGKLLKFSK